MKVEDFDRYFKALHGLNIAPFPWQRRLASVVCESNEWPKVIDLPTGAGKTACIDIALFHLLVSASIGRPFDAARRIAFVVDRRIIVDEAASRARRISDAIQVAKDGVLADAAALLKQLSNQSSLDVVTLRGGVPREKNLVRDPTRVAVVLSTVDQIGSRLLFRGYGVSDSLQPMHAGMFGFDTLLLLDEAHIAEPFRQTLAGIQREQGRAASPPIGVRPLRWSQLSATPSNSPEFSISVEDEENARLKLRLQASKPMQLVEVSKRDELPRKFLDLVTVELTSPPQSDNEQPRIGIVVNRVATAREVQVALVRAFADSVDIHLLIGRTRPIDRDSLMMALTPELKSSETPRPGQRPIVVVATQTIEVGADFDFHTMFVEAASYPAIRQRIGRLNRLGQRKSARGAVVLVSADAEADPVYGSTIGATWQLLRLASTGNVVDLGIQRAPTATLGSAPNTPATPELSPSLLRLLVQTSPRPAIEPDISKFLHGFVEQRADVTVVWREGIYDCHGPDEVRAGAILDALPPLSIEAMSLPLAGFSSWLRGIGSKKSSKVVDSGDLEGDADPDDDEKGAAVKVLVITSDGVTTKDVSEVKPGSTVIAACDWGGCDRYGFAPGSYEHVQDLSLSARSLSRRSATLVFTAPIAKCWSVDELGRSAIADSALRTIRQVTEDGFDEMQAKVAFFDWADSCQNSLRVDVVDAITRLRQQRTAVDLLRDSSHEIFGLVVRAQRPMPEDLVDDTIGLQRTVDVSLEAHCKGVAEYAERFASNLGLSDSLRSDLGLTGRLHDLGKADPRFQSMLGAEGGKLLAKGKGNSFERRVVLGARHECYSVAFVDRHPKLIANARDKDLVRYLIGTHHGRGRCLYPVVDDIGASFEVDIDGETLPFSGTTALASIESSWPELFACLQQRYGAWGLAYLETVLRLADHRRSEAEVDEANQ